MALPTPPSGAITWTRIASADGVGPALLYGSLASSVGTTMFYMVEGGGKARAVASGATPSISSITWTKNAGTGGTTLGPDLYYAPIEATGSHGLYLLPDGGLFYE